MRKIGFWAIPASVLAASCGSVPETGYPCAQDKSCPAPLQCIADKCVNGVADAAAADGSTVDATIDAAADAATDAPITVDAGPDVTKTDAAADSSVDSGSISVSVSPSTATVAGAKTQQFTATVAGSTNQSVTWSVVENDGGSVTSTGLYTAPSKIGTFHVVAKSVADSSKSTAATVNVWYGTFTKVAGSLSVSRGQFSTPARTVSAADGRVLLIGGATTSTTSAALDIYSGTSLTTGVSLTTARMLAGLVLAADGSAIVAGGYGVATSTSPLNSIERWNATSATWSIVPATLTVARAKTQLVRTSDNRIFAVGGEISSSSNSNVIDVMDPAQSYSVASAGVMLLARSNHVAVGLDDGRIFIAGGANGGTIATSSELFKPGASGVAGSSSSGPSMSSGHVRGGVVRLLDGTLLFAGGCSGTTTPCSIGATASEIYTPATGQIGTVAATTGMNVASAGHSMILLASGRVLVVGGADGTNTLNRAEVYDPSTKVWAIVGSLTDARYDAAIGMTSDGKIIVAGGRTGPSATSTALGSVEIFDSGKAKMCKICQFDGSCMTLKDGTPCDDDGTTKKCSSGACVP